MRKVREPIAVPDEPLDLRLEATIIVCTRDRPVDLRRCLVSLVTAQLSGCRVIVVDQSRGPESAAVVAELAGGLQGIEYVASGRTGLSVARNQGAARATMGLLLFTDDDCEVTADWVDGWRRFFEAHHAVGIGFARVAVPEFDPTTGHIPHFDPGPIDRVWGAELFALGAEFVGMGANMAVRHEAWAVVGGFDEFLGAGALPAAEELDLALRVENVGYRVGQAAGPTVIHYGYRDTADASRLAQGYAAATAAMYVKHIRCHDRRAAVLMARDIGRLMVRVGRRAFTGERPTGFNSLRGFVAGIVAAKACPVDVARRLYVVPLDSC